MMFVLFLCICGGGFIYILAHKWPDHKVVHPDLTERTERNPEVLNAATEQDFRWCSDRRE